MTWAVLGRVLKTGISFDLKGKNLYRILERKNHPQYRLGRVGYENNDIALYKLETAAKLGPEIRPVCLTHPSAIPTNVGTRAVVSGWGATSAGV